MSQRRVFKILVEEPKADLGEVIYSDSEQVIDGRVFQNPQQVRAAVGFLVDTNNREWLVEKNGCLSPWHAKAQWFDQAFLAKAALKKLVSRKPDAVHYRVQTSRSVSLGQAGENPAVATSPGH